MKEIAELKEVELRKAWKNEAYDFTPWLAENIDRLSQKVGMDLEVINTEVPVGRYSADIVCKDLNTDEIVVIENQLNQTDHDHLGKGLVYCAGLGAKTLIWVAKNFTDEHRATVDWLNSSTDENTNIFAVEVKLMVSSLNESIFFSEFDIISKPNNWSRTMKQETSVRMRRPDLRFCELGISVGEELIYTEDNSIVKVVDINRTIEYDGKKYTSFKSFMEMKGGPVGRRGSDFFTYKGKKLSELWDNHWKGED